MTFKGALVLGALALVTTTGCASTMSATAGDSFGGDAAGLASPAAQANEDARTCADNGGWYDSVAGACDDIGE